MEKEQIRKVRIEEIAEQANVSTATVSRVLNHPEMVNASTRKRVQQVMSQLGYAYAQKSRSNIILVIVPDITNSFYSEIYRGIYATANRKGYQFVIRQCDANRLPSRDSIRELISLTNASGIILLASATAEELHTIESFLPVVQCCECVEDDEAAYVTIDDYKAEYSITANIIKSGRRRLAFLNHMPSYKFARERRRGFEDAVRDAGLRVNPLWMVEFESYNYQTANSAVTQLLHMKGELPDAIVTTSDIYGVAAIKAIKECGLRVPEDVAVCGFDNIELCYISEPPLTTVSQPAFQMGNLSCELLISKIENSDLRAQHFVLDTEIVVRSSAL